MRTILVLLCAVAALAVPCPAQGGRIDWARDLDVMRAEMPKRHRNLFHTTTEQAFAGAIDRLRERLPRMTDPEVAVEITRIVAMVGDAHTGASLPDALQFPVVPIKLYWYADGIAVQAADPRYRDLLGWRLVAVDGMPVDDVIKRVATVTAASNEMTVRDFGPFRLVRPALLHALGVAKRPDAMAMTFERGGERRTVDLAPIPRKPDGTIDRGGLWIHVGATPGSTWVDACPAERRPLWLRDPTAPFRLERIANGRALYVQCNLVMNGEGAGAESFAGFFDRAIALAEAEKIERFVLDLRLNGGGDNTVLLPAIHRFIRSDWVNRRGRLYVLVGRRTQSAAQNFVNQLQIHTKAIFVGEPTGERPNMYGDPVDLELPSSKITISLSSLWWQDMGPLDTRVWTEPEVRAELSSEDYAAGRDPALEAALARPDS
jgi:hypothetical protein